MNASDWSLESREKYCPNCRQDVFPKRSLISFLIIGVAVLFFFISSGWIQLVWAVALVLNLHSPHTTVCPMCNTPATKLEPPKKRTGSHDNAKMESLDSHPKNKNSVFVHENFLGKWLPKMLFIAITTLLAIIIIAVLVQLLSTGTPPQTQP
jgi:hypothetical protein